MNAHKTLGHPRASAAFTAAGARYIRLEAVQAHNSNVSAPEINILGTQGS